MNQVHFPKTSPPVLARCSPTCQGSLILKVSLVIVPSVQPVAPCRATTFDRRKGRCPSPIPSTLALSLWLLLGMSLIPTWEGMFVSRREGLRSVSAMPQEAALSPWQTVVPTRSCFRPSGEGLGVITSSETGILLFAEARGSLRLRTADFYLIEHDGEAP